MMRRLIGGAVRSTIQELLGDTLRELKEDMGELKEDMRELKEGLRDANKSILSLSVRIDEMGGRLDQRIDLLAAQQGRLVEEVAALKRDQESARNLEHRVMRIEDKIFVRAG